MIKLRRAGASIAALAACGIATVAGAADMRIPVKAVPMSPPPASWTGCYLGAHTGLAAGHTSWVDAVATTGAIDASLVGRTARTDMSGGIYGLQIGCDYQLTGGFVIGAQGATSWSKLAGTIADPFNNTWALRSKVDWLTDAGVRLGYSLNNALVYGRVGYAWARNTLEINNAGVFEGGPALTRTGIVFGGGFEWMFAPKWSVFLEGNYYNFRSANISFKGDTINPTPAFTVRSSLDVETLKLGINYRFGGLGLLGSRY